MHNDVLETTPDVGLSSMALAFNRESAQVVLEEGIDLLKEHYREIAHYQDIEFNPNVEQYLKLDELGFLRIYTARTNANQLVGYAVFFVRHNLHYSGSLQAVQDVLFISKNHRGRGRSFIQWCDEQLKLEHVQVSYHHIKARHNFGAMLERIGYELVDLIYARRLD